MKYKLLIIFCVSFLNSLTVKRRRSYDKIFGVSKEKCENIFDGEDEGNVCECSEEKSTFLSHDNDQYSCRNKTYLGRLLHFLKLVLFAC